jgi:hypothetical protein
MAHQDIREAVEAELKFDPLVNDADIHVVNVNGTSRRRHRAGLPAVPEAARARRLGGVKNVQATWRWCCPTPTSATRC